MSEFTLESIIGRDGNDSGFNLGVSGQALEVSGWTYEESLDAALTIAEVDRLIAWLRDARATMAIHANMPAVHGEGDGYPRGITPWLADAYPGLVEVSSSGYARRAVSMCNPRITHHADGRIATEEN